MVLHYPGIHVSTAEAYGAITPNDHREPLENILDKPIADWKSQLSNDFEAGVSKLHPVISTSIEQLYRAGAIYSAMTGSGSAIFGIFDKPVEIEFDQGDSFTFQLD
jgi:4-diphosphocytidyl-2-C-methyl-D-erythritol kinase